MRKQIEKKILKILERKSERSNNIEIKKQIQILVWWKKTPKKQNKTKKKHCWVNWKKKMSLMKNGADWENDDAILVPSGWLQRTHETLLLCAHVHVSCFTWLNGNKQERSRFQTTQVHSHIYMHSLSLCLCLSPSFSLSLSPSFSLSLTHTHTHI